MYISISTKSTKPQNFKIKIINYTDVVLSTSSLLNFKDVINMNCPRNFSLFLTREEDLHKLGLLVSREEPATIICLVSNCFSDAIPVFSDLLVYHRLFLRPRGRLIQKWFWYY